MRGVNGLDYLDQYEALISMEAAFQVTIRRLKSMQAKWVWVAEVCTIITDAVRKAMMAFIQKLRHGQSH